MNLWPPSDVSTESAYIVAVTLVFLSSWANLFLSQILIRGVVSTQSPILEHQQSTSTPLLLTPCSYRKVGLAYLLGASYLCPIFPFLPSQFTIIILPGLLQQSSCLRSRFTLPVLHTGARMTKYVTGCYLTLRRSAVSPLLLQIESKDFMWLCPWFLPIPCLSLLLLLRHLMS